MFPTRRLLASTSRLALPNRVADILSVPLKSDSLPVTVIGHVRSVRKQKKRTFLSLVDGSCDRGLQVMLENPETSVTSALSQLSVGTTLQLTGQLVASPARGQDRELQLGKDKDALKILGTADPFTYPVPPHPLTTEYLRDRLHLRARTSFVGAMMRTRSTLNRRLASWFEDHAGFLNVQTPIITGNDAEGAGEAFRLARVPPRSSSASSSMAYGSVSQPPLPKDEEFFDSPAYLTVSGQLHLEALSWALGRVYTLSPCFRAERSQTGRHLAEFWMLEAEWTQHGPQEAQLGEIMDVVEDSVKYAVEALNTEDLDVMWKHEPLGGEAPVAGPGRTKEDKRKLFEVAIGSARRWERVTYSDSVKILQDAKGLSKPPPAWGEDFASEHETYLAETVARGPLFITHYPQSLKPFYMRKTGRQLTGAFHGETVDNFDLIIPFVGELAGGSVREERENVLRDQIPVNSAALEWYLDLRRHGTGLHGGFGMGFERLVAWVGGIENVRECVAWPRWTGRLSQ